MFWIPFYKILQKTRGDITKADPTEIQYAAKENVEHGESPSSAYRAAWEEYLKDRNLQL